MVSAPWSPEAVAFAQANPEADLGIHLTQTSESEPYVWRSILPAAHLKSLVGLDGRFLRGWPARLEP